MEIHTDVWNLRFFVKGNRICFITRTPEGKESRHWSDLSPKTLKAITKEINAYSAQKTKEAAMTSKERAEYHEEMMGT
jgi:hypothetical protein